MPYSNELIARDEHSAFSGCGDYYQKERPEVLALVPFDARRILEVGCATGQLGRAIKSRQQCIVYGVELDAGAARVAQDRLDKVWNAPIETVLHELDDEFFDCIILADVIEHLVDPWNILSKLKEKLLFGGKVIASVPNVAHWKVIRGLIEGQWHYQSEGLLDRTHLRFFTLSSIRELFWNAGFKVSQTKAIQREDEIIPKKFVRFFERSELMADSVEDRATAFQYLILAERMAPNINCPKIHVVILNWNGKDDSLECLKSVQKIDYTNFDVVVVDNGSTDDSVKAIRCQFPKVNLIESKVNRGYAGGNNIGISHALQNGAEYILLLNNDTVIESQILKEFLAAAELVPDGGIFAAKILYYSEPGNIWYAGGSWSGQLSQFQHIGMGSVDNSMDFGAIKETDYCCGCALFVSTETVKRIGMLEEKFFLMYEEADWCYRATRHGHKCIFVPGAKVWHKVSRAFGGERTPLHQYFIVRNRLLWAKRNLPFRRRLRVWRSVVAEICRDMSPSFDVPSSGKFSSPKELYWEARENLADWIVKLRRAKLRAELLGLRDYILGRFGKPDSMLQMMTTISDRKV